MKIGEIIVNDNEATVIILIDPNVAIIHRKHQVIGITDKSKYVIVEHRVLNNINTTDRDYYLKYGSSKEEDIHYIKFDVIKSFDTKEEAQSYLDMKAFW